MPEGIEKRETARGPVYVARVYDPKARKRVSRTFPRESQAKAWRRFKADQAARGVSIVEASGTLREAADAFIAGIKSGAILTNRGTRYKPSTIRIYEHSLENHVLDSLGATRLARIQRKDVQRIVDRMLADGKSATMIRNAVFPLRVIYRRAVQDGDVSASPCEHLRLPALTTRRERIAPPDEAARLLAALPDGERALWACAFFAGLRFGELRALAWDAVDFDAGLVRVVRAMDATGEIIEPKSKAGRRSVPLIEPLRRELVRHRLASGRDHGLVFGSSASQPFSWMTANRRALEAWTAAKLAPIGLHEARHTFASFLIASGVNAKAVSIAMGHGSIAVTYDVYGKLFPGNEAETAGLLEAFLARADTAGRVAQIEAVV